MNTAIVTRIEYRLLPDGVFAEISFTAFSGTLSKKATKTVAGDLHETNLQFKVPEVQPETTAILDGLFGRKAQYRVTDSNGKIHLVGDNSYPARLGYEQSIDGTPGSWNGYAITILHKAPYSYSVS